MSRETYLRLAAIEVWDKLSASVGTTTRVTTALLKMILLKYGDSTFLDGRKIILTKRALGAGVYEIGFKWEVLKTMKTLNHRAGAKPAQE